ncbi:unnamed protein product [Fusarium graminearum]|uniref:Chromosome 4, complete genome n=1 Tax=Gibberella zeae (strain ATCC MYA-4620 / CBS 123657 / FGSC 9075 / NRRL 31084 / PH-1) TaxID=229533 RepID=I1S8G7_GIBZE|nr:hypothetical protein FGSG_13145 [Fusarium graminearum PH-1]KAI6755249.1 hypothetical protein HG531_004355 [Fusarium graminearum]ESU13665.1 hypothetical protein FGSG_13145 [Fusarium graminearum PH-1]PCD40813.1 hypothetical protein FGRA07_02084 [Fusarium graminearum]CAF3446925.1 unnamed protein product [Fusarium graminearum]CAG1990989.1 unnamed protein product [Fusarium graminearum]|eukprot:XP_011327172.1 hypothetical protein FGSG_13145 [Fusarium graminearum PH-1]
MDDTSRLRRQNEPSVHSNPNQRYSLHDPSQQRRSVAGASNDRYRPASLATPSSSGRGMGAAGNYSSYYSEPSASFPTANMPGTAIAYGSEYGHDSRQQQQGFGGYGTAATMMYNVAQPNPQNPVYDAQHFSSRQPAGLQMMTPDVASTYFASETGSAAGPSLHQSAQSSSGSANVYQQSNAMSYASNNMSSVNAMPQPTASADVSMAEDHDYAEGALEEKWVSYQRQLGSIFQDISDGSLESASETLLSVTSWLLSQVADLGLNLDDTNLHADRIQLWNDFNHAWLGLGQQQIDLMASSQQLSRAQSLVSKAMIKKMGNELIRLCDGIERHGLVDYQYGVWEDQITEVLEDILDLYEDSEEASGSGNR